MGSSSPFAEPKSDPDYEKTTPILVLPNWTLDELNNWKYSEGFWVAVPVGLGRVLIFAF